MTVHDRFQGLMNGRMVLAGEYGFLLEAFTLPASKELSFTRYSFYSWCSRCMRRPGEDESRAQSLLASSLSTSPTQHGSTMKESSFPGQL